MDRLELSAKLHQTDPSIAPPRILDNAKLIFGGHVGGPVEDSKIRDRLSS